jgi:hypothetical protein
MRFVTAATGLAMEKQAPPQPLKERLKMGLWLAFWLWLAIGVVGSWFQPQPYRPRHGDPCEPNQRLAGSDLFVVVMSCVLKEGKHD